MSAPAKYIELNIVYKHLWYKTTSSSHINKYKCALISYYFICKSFTLEFILKKNI